MSNFALVQVDPFKIIREWHAIPDQVEWPNGNIGVGVAAGVAHDKWKVVPIKRAGEQPNEFYQPAGSRPSFDGDAVVVTQKWAPLDIAVVIPSILSRVDQIAEAKRLQHITGGAGQALTYQAKAAEAHAYLAGASTNPGDYPFLSATIGADGATLADVAQSVASHAAQWEKAGAAIEGARRAAKKKISEATTVDDAVAVLQSIPWPA